MKTRITELFGIKYPILLAGMNWGTRPKLVAAVSNAGGLGMLGAAAYSSDGLKEAIAEIRLLTDKPFAVNLSLFLPGARELVQTVLEAQVPVINIALGRATEIVKATHTYGGKVIATVALLRHAQYYERDGADALIVTGHEAAAHAANVGGLVLIPTIAGKVKIPVVATGGFSNGQGLVAALALGAEGISLGTRFALTVECDAHDNFKQCCLDANEEDTIISNRFDGVNCRVLKNKRAEALAKGDILQGQPIMRSGLVDMQKAIEDGDVEHGLLLAGQGCGFINDVPTCQEVIERIVAEAEEVIEATRGQFHPQ
ncbi:NAD(P)H-dependent flavin oxidoreductase [Chloroflexota bacterium]